MFNKNTLLISSLIVMLLLSSCTLGQAAEPTPTEVDVNAISTAAAATAFAQLTEIAGLASPTTPPTNTSQPSPTLDAAAGTPTISVEIQITAQPEITITPLGLGTLAPVPGAGVPTLTSIPTQSSTGGQPVVTCNNFAFVADITVPDGTVFKPADKFTKVWRLQNTGTCPWDQGYVFKWVAGAGMGSSNSYAFNDTNRRVAAGATADVDIFMFAPDQEGEYTGNWTMFNDQGQQFGYWVTVNIKVQK